MAKETDIDIKKTYQQYIRKKKTFLFFLLLLLVICSIISLHVGSSKMTVVESFAVLLGNENATLREIIFQIRLPRLLGGLLIGMNLALSGLIIQSSLNNPLASPTTIGISSASAAGANVALILFSRWGIERNLWLTALSSFLMAMACMSLVLLISNLRTANKTTVVLAGTAFHALFLAFITIIQYFADDTELASAVAWTFGDLGRVHFDEIVILAVVTALSVLCMYALRWQMNALDMGEQSAHSLGIPVRHLRNLCILIAALNTGVSVAFAGIIGFVGLLAPQMTKRLIGEDKRFMIPAALLSGACIVLASDALARVVVAPLVLPVGAVTSLFGAPLFLYVLLKGR